MRVAMAHVVICGRGLHSVFFFIIRAAVVKLKVHLKLRNETPMKSRVNQCKNMLYASFVTRSTLCQLRSQNRLAKQAKRVSYAC